MQKLIIFIILLASVMAAYAVHTVIKKSIDPRKSFGYFMLYILLHLITVFITVFSASFLIFKCSSLMFKK